MKNKGFVLMETIIVIVVITVSLVTIFFSYNKILTKVKEENKYDTSDYIYITHYIKNFLKNAMSDNISAFFGCRITDDTDTCVQSINNNIKNYYQVPNGGIPQNFYPLIARLRAIGNLYGVKKIYIITGFDSFSNNETKFDAYMIDYIRKLDVKDDDKLIIVEYKKLVRDTNYNPLQMETDNNSITDKNLYETYISSLEW